MALLAIQGRYEGGRRWIGVEKDEIGQEFD